MFDKNEVIRRLQNGETLDEIADSMTAALNDAANEYEKSKVDIERKNKILDMTEILNLIHDYILDYYTNSHSEIDSVNEIFSDKIVEEVVDGIDASYKEINLLFDCVKPKKKSHVCECEKEKTSTHDVLKDFAEMPNVKILNILDADAEDKLHSFLDMFINKANKSN